MRGIEIQLRTRSKVLQTREGRALSFGFSLGPVGIFVIANLPEPNGNEEGPLVYIKLNLKTDEGWQVFREHYSAEPPAVGLDKRQYSVESPELPVTRRKR